MILDCSQVSRVLGDDALNGVLPSHASFLHSNPRVSSAVDGLPTNQPRSSEVLSKSQREACNKPSTTEGMGVSKASCLIDP